LPNLPATHAFNRFFVAEVMRPSVVPFHASYRLADGSIESPYLITP
jgi:hypothetical protein